MVVQCCHLHALAGIGEFLLQICFMQIRAIPLVRANHRPAVPNSCRTGEKPAAPSKIRHGLSLGP